MYKYVFGIPAIVPCTPDTCIDGAGCPCVPCAAGCDIGVDSTPGVSGVVGSVLSFCTCSPIGRGVISSIPLYTSSTVLPLMISCKTPGCTSRTTPVVVTLDP